MKGAAYIVCAATGMGKTTWVKSKLANVHVDARLVYDVNAEYTDLYNGEFLEDFEDFAKLGTTVKNSMIVYEEATAFLSNKGGNRYLRKTLVAKRHDGNVIFLVFHSLRAIPRDLYDLCNYVVLFKTSDIEQMVKTRFDNDALTSEFLRLQKAPMIVTDGHEHSPYSIIKIQPTL